MNLKNQFRIGVSLFVLLLGNSSYATLGQKSDSVEADRSAVSGSALRTVARGSYTVREIQGKGFSFKEYLSKGDVVFGMTWTGKLPLSLSAIFGSYVADYQQAADKAASQRKFGKERVRVPHLLIQGSQVTLERFGQGRGVHTRAIVQQLIPTGVTADEIQ